MQILRVSSSYAENRRNNHCLYEDCNWSRLCGELSVTLFKLMFGLLHKQTYSSFCLSRKPLKRLIPAQAAQAPAVR